MNRQVDYPSGFKCRKWTLVVLITIDLIVLILTTIALVNRQGGDTNGMDPDNLNKTSRIPSLNQITNAVNTVGDNLAKLNITKINVDLGPLNNNATREFLDNIWNKARDNEGQTKWIGQIIALVIGFIICLIGLVGVITEHYCLTVTYAVVTFVGLLYTTIIGIFAEEPVLVGKIIMYILFLLLVAWFIIDLRNIRRQKSQV